ncbi:MAG: hypothetical protein KJO44_09090, partial [Gemmatimonadetes bacterium]|nr:hypothetical protein [Gemmatimonadota bacterium]
MTELPPIRHRVRAVYIALVLSWAAFVVVGISRTQALKPLTGDGYPVFGVALVLLTIAPWRRVLYSIVADLVILFWSTLVMAGVLILGGDTDSTVIAVALL